MDFSLPYILEVLLIFVMRSGLQETVRAGDVVSFQIADNLKAAQQAEALGSVVSCLVGKSMQLKAQPCLLLASGPLS